MNKIIFGRVRRLSAAVPHPLPEVVRAATTRERPRVALCPASPRSRPCLSIRARGGARQRRLHPRPHAPDPTRTTSARMPAPGSRCANCSMAGCWSCTTARCCSNSRRRASPSASCRETPQSPAAVRNAKTASASRSRSTIASTPDLRLQPLQAIAPHSLATTAVPRINTRGSGYRTSPNASPARWQGGDIESLLERRRGSG